MRLFINSLAASAGGGLTYIRNVIPRLAELPAVQATVALGPGLREEFRGFTGVDFLELEKPASRRFWYEQTALPGLILRSGADVLLSAGNFALRKSPVPQILLSRNSIYTSADFYRDLLSRHEYRMWLETRLQGALARKSIVWTDVTVAPSEAFAAELRRWVTLEPKQSPGAGVSGDRIRAIYHGFDGDAFQNDFSQLAPEVEEKLRGADDSLKLLFVSHYNYYRNFETLIRALPFLRDRCAGRAVKLLLTCALARGTNPGAYDPAAAADLVRKLGVSEMVIELGSIPYRQLHRVYRRADIYVTPAYTETFAHPLVEAMASGLPVVASDLAVHREICGDAAIYFPRFSSDDLAASVMQLVEHAGTVERMVMLGRERAKRYSWKTHVEAIVELAGTLVARK